MTGTVSGIIAGTLILALSFFVRGGRTQLPPAKSLEEFVGLPDVASLGPHASSVQQLLMDLASFSVDHWRAVSQDEQPVGRTAARKLVSAYKEAKAHRSVNALIARGVLADGVAAVDAFVRQKVPNEVGPSGLARARMAAFACLYEGWLSDQDRIALLEPVAHFRPSAQPQ